MKTILLIEDNFDIRENTAEILELSGYRMITAVNGNDGCKLAEEEIPDLILCDIMMPGMNGYEVLSAIRENANTKLIPLIFVTASTEYKDIQLAFDLGANAYVRKPFEKEELVLNIENCLRSNSNL